MFYFSAQKIIVAQIIVAIITIMRKCAIAFVQGEAIDDLPESVVQDCAQLVKANSIHGNHIYPLHFTAPYAKYSVK